MQMTARIKILTGMALLFLAMVSSQWVVAQTVDPKTYQGPATLTVTSATFQRGTDPAVSTTCSSASAKWQDSLFVACQSADSVNSASRNVLAVCVGPLPAGIGNGNINLDCTSSDVTVTSGKISLTNVALGSWKGTITMQNNVFFASDYAVLGGSGSQTTYTTVANVTLTLPPAPPPPPLKGSISFSTPITLPIKMGGLGADTSASANVNVTGTHDVNFVPDGKGSYTLSGGVKDGAFSLDKALQFNTSLTVKTVKMDVSATANVTGTWTGYMSGSIAENNVQFNGSWNATLSGSATTTTTLPAPIPGQPATKQPPKTSTIAQKPQSTGGKFTFKLPIDPNTGTIPTMNAAYSGTVVFTLDNPADASQAIPVEIPFSFNGSNAVTVSK